MEPPLLLEQRTQLFASLEIEPHYLLSCIDGPVARSPGRALEGLQTTRIVPEALGHLLEDTLSSSSSLTNHTHDINNHIPGSLKEFSLLPRQMPMSLAVADPLRAQAQAHRVETAESSTSFGFADIASTAAATPRAVHGRQLNTPPRCPAGLVHGPAFYAQVALAANRAFLLRWSNATHDAPPTMPVLCRVLDNSIGMAQLAATEVQTAAAVARAVAPSLGIVSRQSSGQGGGLIVHHVTAHAAGRAASARSSMFAHCASGVTEATNERDRRARLLDVHIQRATLQCCLCIQGLSSGNSVAIAAFLGLAQRAPPPPLQSSCLALARRLRRAMRLHFQVGPSSSSRLISHSLGGALATFSMALHSVYAPYCSAAPSHTHRTAAHEWQQVSHTINEACAKHESGPTDRPRQGAVHVVNSLELGGGVALDSQHTDHRTRVPHTKPSTQSVQQSQLSLSHMRAKGAARVSSRVPAASGESAPLRASVQGSKVPPALRQDFSRYMTAVQNAQWASPVCIPGQMGSASFVQSVPVATQSKVAACARRHAAEDTKAFIKYLVAAVFRRFSTLNAVIHGSSVAQVDAHLASAPLAVIAGQQQSTATAQLPAIRDVHASFISPARRGWLLPSRAASSLRTEMNRPSPPPLHMQTLSLAPPPAPLRRIIPLRPGTDVQRSTASAAAAFKRTEPSGTPHRDASWNSAESPIFTGRGQDLGDTPPLAPSPLAGPMLSSMLDSRALGHASPRGRIPQLALLSSSPLISAGLPAAHVVDATGAHAVLREHCDDRDAMRDDLSDCSVESEPPQGGAQMQRSLSSERPRTATLHNVSAMLKRSIEVEVWRCVTAHAYGTLYALEAAVERCNDERFNTALHSVQQQSEELLVPGDRHHTARTVWLCPPSDAGVPPHLQSDCVEATVLAYLPALRALHAFTQHRSGIGKAQCAAVVLRSASACAAGIAAAQRGGAGGDAGSGLSADELLPLLVWLLAVAGCRSLPSQVAFTEEWLPPSHSIGDWGYAAAMLSAAARGLFSGALRT